MPYKDLDKQRQTVAASVRRYREANGNNWAEIKTTTPKHYTNEMIVQSIQSHLSDIRAVWELRKSYDYSDPTQRNDYDKCSNKIKEKRKRVEHWLKVLIEQRHVEPASLGLDMDEVLEWIERGKRK